MQIPGKIKILGKQFTVTQEPNLRADDGKSRTGQCNATDLSMKINAHCPQETKESTLLHEILEAIDMLLELGLNHHQICILEETLYQVLKENNLCFGNYQTTLF